MGSKTIFIPRQKLFSRVLKYIRPYRLCLISLALSAFLLILIRVLPASYIESIYSKNIFRKISYFTGLVSRHLPFSLAGIILWGLSALATLAILALPILLFVLPQRLKLLETYLRVVATLLALILLVFTLTCAPNYYRFTFAQQSGLVIRDSSVSELEALCEELIEKTNIARLLVNDIDMPFSELSQKTFEAFNMLEEDYPFMGKAMGPPKPMLFPEILSIFNLTGFYFPYTAEANINVHMPQTEMAFTACHELAHTNGFMREDEANFIGYLACLKSPEFKVQYSGLYVALMQSMNALYSSDSQRYFTLRKKFSPAVSNDLIQIQKYWVKYFNTPASEASNVINDTYLKANNLADGTQSYGRMVDLLLAQYRQAHGIT
ncbi:MAG: DUF3810 domain-containing protein [Candidatus Fimivivens sp.]|nr:DUF3810 domain-containing protein [Candidatus Fimivivens sp.]